MMKPWQSTQPEGKRREREREREKKSEPKEQQGEYKCHAYYYNMLN
jgi:hypothetical protein